MLIELHDCVVRLDDISLIAIGDAREAFYVYLKSGSIHGVYFETKYECIQQYEQLRDIWMSRA